MVLFTRLGKRKANEDQLCALGMVLNELFEGFVLGLYQYIDVCGDSNVFEHCLKLFFSFSGDVLVGDDTFQDDSAVLPALGQREEVSQ